jgi:cytochrome bd-type quinol oxidase subunit 2
MRPLVALMVFSLVVSTVASAADDEETAKERICQVLSNIQSLLVMMVIGTSLVIYLPLLLAGVIIFMLVKGEEKLHKTIRKITKIALIAFPPLVLAVVIVVYSVGFIFGGGC